MQVESASAQAGAFSIVQHQGYVSEPLLSSLNNKSKLQRAQIIGDEKSSLGIWAGCRRNLKNSYEAE